MAKQKGTGYRCLCWGHRSQFGWTKEEGKNSIFSIQTGRVRIGICVCGGGGEYVHVLTLEVEGSGLTVEALHLRDSLDTFS